MITNVPEQIKTIETKNLKGRLILFGLTAAALLFGWFAIRWQIGNMFAALTPANDPNAREVAEFARDLSPRDPLINWFKGNVEKDKLTEAGLAQAVTDFERMIRSAPADYRYWLEIARVFEQQNDDEKAEKAFRRAVELAPNYSNVYWQIGNYYLRRGDESQAIGALRKSAETSAVYREQVFSVVWDYFEKDKRRLDELAGDRGDLRAGLAKFYAAKEQAEDSLRLWNTLSDDEKQRNQDIARLIAQALWDKRFYRSSIEFVRQLGIEREAQAETVQNGGFETAIATDPGGVFFGWQYLKKDKIEINTDPIKKKEGSRSLRLTFNGFTGIEVKNFQQTVVVQANKKYRLKYWLKTEELKSAGTPTFEIVNANDSKIITTSAPFPAGTQDWTQLTIEFTTPPNAEAVALRFDRAYCGENCPLIGTVWIDDFRLEAV